MALRRKYPTKRGFAITDPLFWPKIAFVFIVGIGFGILILSTNILFADLLRFLMLMLLACVLALLLDIRKILLTGKEY